MVLRRRLKKCPAICSCDYFVKFSFHSMRKGARWDACRENLSSEFDRTKNKDFLCVGEPKRINNIIEYVENLLNIKNRYHTSVYPVQRPTMKKTPYGYEIPTFTYVRPSEFWTADPIRLEFLTALIKGSHTYTGKDYLNVIMRVGYFDDVPRATAMFLTGFTFPQKDLGVGWTDTFEGVIESKRYDYEEKSLKQSLKTLKRMLRKPSTKKQCRFFRRGNPTSQLSAKDKNKLRLWVQREEGRKIPKSQMKDECPFGA